MTIEIEGFDHVAITAPAELEDEVIAWYADVMGLKRIGKPEGTRVQGGWFEVGGQQLHILIDEHNPPKDAHFCMVVSDIDASIETLRGAGCHIEQAAAIPGRRRFYTRDPAGNRIEITAHD